MEINLKKELGLIFSSKTTKVLVSNQETFSGDDFDIVVSKDFKGKGFGIQSPGEYEVGGITITALNSKGGKEIDILELIIEDICIVVLRKGFKYSKSLHDNLGDVNVLLAKAEEIESEKLISKFDPEVFVTFGEEEDFKKLFKKAGITNFDTSKKVEFDVKRFGKDDYVLETFVIEG